MLPQVLTLEDAGGVDSFVYGANRIGVERADGSVGLFSYDPFGSATATTATADVVRSGSYSPHGQQQNAAWADPLAHTPAFGYRGELTLDNTIHLRARTYMPAEAVFTTRDPLDGQAGTPTVTSPYHYTANDPINKTDPTGLRPGDGGYQLPMEKYLLQDTFGACPDCVADPGGSPLKSKAFGLWKVWDPSGYDDDALHAARMIGVDPRLVFSVFVQEARGGYAQGPVANDLQYGYCKVYSGPTCPATIGPTNLTGETLGEILDTSSVTRLVLSRLSGGDVSVDAAVFWIKQTAAGEGHQKFAATATAARMQYLHGLVRQIADEEGVKRADWTEGLAISRLPNSFTYLETSMIGVGWNSQVRAASIIRGVFINGVPSDAPDALKNLRGDGRGYMNQYTGAYCEAARQLQGGACWHPGL